MTKLFLHAGTQKTGTTAIQAFARRNRSGFRERGLLYPDVKPHRDGVRWAHHVFARAVARRTDEIGDEDIRSLVSRWREDAEERDASLFFSSELAYRLLLSGDTDRDWFGARERYLGRLADVFRGFDVEVVLVFRRPEDFIRSAFQESVKNRSDTKRWSSFEEFREKNLSTRLLYHKNLKMFEKHFQKVNVLIFDDLLKGRGLVHEFFRNLGFDVSGFKERGVVRKSPTPAQTMVKLFLNGLGKIEDNDKAIEYVDSEEARKLMERHFGPGPFGVWEGRETLDGFVGRLAGEMEELRSERFPGRAALFEPLGELPPPVPEIREEFRNVLSARTF